MRSKLFYFFLVSLLVIFLESFMLFSASAANYTLYSSVSPSESIVSNLIGLYLNSEGYDPYNEYYCCRVGQYDYILFYGKSITEHADFYRYTGTGTQYNMNYVFSEGSDDNLHINYNNYVGVGNVPGSIQSDKHTNFGFGYVVTVLLILITILVIFKTFRKVHRPRSDRGYTL